MQFARGSKAGRKELIRTRPFRATLNILLGKFSFGKLRFSRALRLGSATAAINAGKSDVIPRPKKTAKLPPVSATHGVSVFKSLFRSICSTGTSPPLIFALTRFGLVDLGQVCLVRL